MEFLLFKCFLLHNQHLVKQQEEAEEGSKQHRSADMYYKYEELRSRPYITPDSEIPENLLHLSYPSSISKISCLIEISSCYISSDLLSTC